MNYDISFSCISSKGNVRTINQDNYICNGSYLYNHESASSFPLSGTVNSKKQHLFGIFDGMGGEECGEIASFIAAKEAVDMKVVKDGVLVLKEYCERANDKICEYAKENSVVSMGTTAAMLLFYKREITLCNIGDSKVFRFANANIDQISEDHIAVSAFGRKPPLLQNLGIPPDQMLIEPYFSRGKCRDGDKYLICSDGLTDMLSTCEIKAIIENRSISDAAIKLVDEALKNGGRDNITVILLEIKQKTRLLLKTVNKKSGGRKI